MTVHPTATLGCILALAGASLVLLTRQGTWRGALAGFVVASLAALGFGAGAFLPLAIFVLGSGFLTRLGRSRKERLGAAEGDHGRRGLAHVAAKLSLPALASLLAVLTSAPHDVLALVYGASLAGAFADTAATELGPVLGGPAIVLRGGRVTAASHGTTGAMSLSGFLASAIAAILVSLGAYAVRLLPLSAATWTAAAGFLGAALESLFSSTTLGARAGHFGRNALLTAASAGLALSARALGWTGS